MINKKKISVVLLSGAMLISMSVPAFSMERHVITGTADNPATINVEKNLVMAEGIAVPNTSFEFDVQKLTTDAPDLTITPITYTDSDVKGEVSDGKYNIIKKSQLVFGNFPHAGEYKYTITEKNTSFDGITYDAESYTLTVQVSNKQAGGLYIKTIAAKKQNGEKPENLEFTNTYRRNGSLTIEKKTTGDLADKTKEFDFEITFIKSATEGQEKPIYIGNIGSQTVSATAGETTTFKLKDGQKLVFDNLPAGTRYTVKEIGAEDGYTAYGKVTENGIQGTEINASGDNADLELNNKLVGENDNKVEFENKFNETPITGIIMNNIPFVLMVSVAVAGFGILALVKRRKIVR